MTKLSENIVRLRSAGYTYDEIVETLGCSKGTVAYHCGEGQKAKTRERTTSLRSSNSLLRKVGNFQKSGPPVRTEKRVLTGTLAKGKYKKSAQFQTNLKTGEVIRNFSYKDVVDKFGSTSVCYLTGDQIDLEKPGTFHFDHVLPRSRGGDNSFENLGLATREANFAKNDLTQEEFLSLCLKVVKNHGYSVTPIL